MYGPGLAPPQSRRPSTAALVVLRVVFVLVALFSLGFLSWAGLLRVAALTRKKSDWRVFWAGVAAVLLALMCFFVADTVGFNTYPVGMGLLLLAAVAGATYFLYADIRHFETPAVPPGSGHVPGVPGQQPPGSGYGYPLPPSPYPSHTVPQHLAGQTPPSQPVYHGPTQPMAPAPEIPGRDRTPHPTPPPRPHPGAAPTPMTPPASRHDHARIDQVRAELDELSDYLRRQEGDGGYGPQGDGGYGPQGDGGYGPQGDGGYGPQGDGGYGPQGDGGYGPEGGR